MMGNVELVLRSMRKELKRSRVGRRGRGCIRMNTKMATVWLMETALMTAEGRRESRKYDTGSNCCNYSGMMENGYSVLWRPRRYLQREGGGGGGGGVRCGEDKSVMKMAVEMLWATYWCGRRLGQHQMCVRRGGNRNLPPL